MMNRRCEAFIDTYVTKNITHVKVHAITYELSVVDTRTPPLQKWSLETPRER